MDAATAAGARAERSMAHQVLQPGGPMYMIRPRSPQLAIILAVAVCASSRGAEPVATREQVLAHLDRIRAVRAGAGKEATDQFNQQMDEAWRFFESHPVVAPPTLREQVALEIRKERPSQLVLLDAGYFLHTRGAPQDRHLAKEALFALDPAADIFRANDKQLFEFTHRVAATRDARTLAFVDRAFLRRDVKVFIPQHALNLDETLVCVFLYGVYGDGAEQHLIPLLRDPAATRRVMEILIWIGSPAAIPEEELDPKSAEYFQKVLPAVRDTGYEGLRRAFGPPDAAPRLDGKELRRRLATMAANDGRDDSTRPGSLLESALPGSELIAELTNVRTAALRRLSDEGLSDVEMTSALINALRYRGR